jgi:hypothetical protein
MDLELFGKITENTGYGTATRNIIESLRLLDINLKLSGSGMKCDNSLIDPYIQLHMQCPPFKGARSGRLKSKYRIGYFYWETDRLPKQWGKSIRWLDEVWAPCELVKNCLIKEGFSGPIEIVPTSAKTSGSISKFNISIGNGNVFLSENIFKFYSIFQWNERKGWKELLGAYFDEFSSEDNVVLIIKTRPLKNNVEQIKDDILNLKRKFNKKKFPMLYLVTKDITEGEINGIHQYADCYVSPHHGEGWGMPIHDAINFKNELIITKFGGITEFLDENSANIIKHTMGPVKNMKWCSFYGSYQSWANPSKKSLSEIMRKVYLSDRDECKINNAYNIASSFDIEGVSKVVKNILKKDRFKHL